MTAGESRFVIRLEGLRFFSRIGVMSQERTVGNEFVVDVRFSIPAVGVKDDSIDNTVSYADVYDLIAGEMRREWNLLESVAKSIGDGIARRWALTSDIHVKLTKMAPPITGCQGVCSVEYETPNK